MRTFSAKITLFFIVVSFIVPFEIKDLEPILQFFPIITPPTCLLFLNNLFSFLKLKVSSPIKTSVERYVEAPISHFPKIIHLEEM